ncbi:hypothetical protein I3760_15G139000 [Carya illinoinensis]|nr:hypothetical protein I3760_15G139000 [Carya illinoinensis]
MFIGRITKLLHPYIYNSLSPMRFVIDEGSSFITVLCNCTHFKCSISHSISGKFSRLRQPTSSSDFRDLNFKLLDKFFRLEQL